MATATNRSACVKCDKPKAIMKCEGCLEAFCYNHMMHHRQELGEELDELEGICDTIRRTLTEQTIEPRKHALIQQIDKWERDLINKVRQTAEKARQLILKHTAGHFTKKEVQLNQLTDLLQQSRQNNDFVEIDLIQWKQELDRLMKQLTDPWNVKIQQDSSPLVIKIDIYIATQNYIPSISASAKWIQNGVTVAGGNEAGNEFNQFSKPYSLRVDDDQNVYVVDYDNHRVVQWKSGATIGEVVAGGNGKGNQADQLNNPTDIIIDKESDSLIICDYGNKRVMRWPRQNGASGEIIISNIACWGLTMDNDGYLYVTDHNNHEVRRWKIGDISGIVVAGGNRAGNCLSQFHYPTYIFVDQDQSVYVSDGNNHRVMKWMQGAKQGIIVAGDQSKGSGLTQISTPMGVLVDQLGTVYVADHNNHRVMRWLKGATQGSVVVGGNGPGKQANQLYHPVGLSFDRQNNLYVIDYYSHQVQKFNIESNSNT